MQNGLFYVAWGAAKLPTMKFLFLCIFGFLYQFTNYDLTRVIASGCVVNNFGIFPIDYRNKLSFIFAYLSIADRSAVSRDTFIMYSVIEFNQEADGGGLSIVNTAWLTPRKTEVCWPPIKDNSQFNKVLRKLEPEITENWKLYGVQKIFYSTDDFEKATKKLKIAEITSDLQTDLDEDHDNRPKRRILKRKFSSDESDSDEPLFRKLGKKSKQRLPRPPPVKINNPTNARGLSQELKSGTDESNIRGCYSSKLLNNTSTPRSNKLFCQISTSKASSSGSKEATAVQTPTLNESANIDNILQDKNGLKVLLNNILIIKEQNRKILDILQKSNIPIKNTDLPEDLKLKLPVDSLEDLEELEVYLTQEENFKNFKSYCASISNSKEVTQKNNRILRSLFTDGIAKFFNYFGNNRQKKESNKRPFNQLRLNKVILDAVKQGANFTTQEVENAIKRWLKHAPNRNKKN